MINRFTTTLLKNIRELLQTLNDLGVSYVRVSDDADEPTHGVIHVIGNQHQEAVHELLKRCNIVHPLTDNNGVIEIEILGYTILVVFTDHDLLYSYSRAFEIVKRIDSNSMTTKKSRYDLFRITHDGGLCDELSRFDKYIKLF